MIVVGSTIIQHAKDTFILGGPKQAWYREVSKPALEA